MPAAEAHILELLPTGFNKQSNEVIFSRKSTVHSYPPLTLNNNDNENWSHQKRLRFILDLKLNFNIHANNRIYKNWKMIGIIKRLSVIVPKKVLVTIYKSFIRSHLDYRDLLYDKPENQNFQNKLEKV